MSKTPTQNAYEDLSEVVTFRPLTNPFDAHQSEVEAPFTAPWATTVSLLAREVRHLNPREAVLELDIPQRAFRQDGMPRIGVAAYTPGVVLTLAGRPNDARYPPGASLVYPASTFDHWQDNVRAIALSLEALRKVDRYGVVKRGEQYHGSALLETSDARAKARGRELITEHGSVRAALAATHPDRTGGDDADFKAITAAAG